MTFIVWNTHTDSLHFPKTYTTIEEAANDVHQHVTDAPFEYDLYTKLAVLKIRIDPHNEQSVIKHEVAYIDIKQSAWLCVHTSHADIHLILPKRTFKKPLPRMSHVVIWNFSGRERAGTHEYMSAEDAANAIGRDVNVYKAQDVFGLFEKTQLAQLRLTHGRDVPMDKTQLTITIEKKAWLLYIHDTRKDRMLLPLSKRTIKRRTRKQKTTQ